MYLIINKIKTNMKIKIKLDDLSSDIEEVKRRALSAGTRFRLMALVADITEVAEGLQQEVLQRVSQEAVLDVDADTDFALLAERVLAMELEAAAADVHEETQTVNEALGMLSTTLSEVDRQLSRHHRDEEYARLYEQEKRRYLSSGTARRAKQKFEEWKDFECNGSPQPEQIEEYRTEKLLHMFEKGVLASRVEHIQRAKRYPGEVDFEQLDDDHPLKQTLLKHYAALRKQVDYIDGCLVVDPVRAGRHFYACRKDENAKTHRTNFLKYMHKIDMAQEELRRLQAERQEVAEEESCPLPEVLATERAMKYWRRLQASGLLDDHYQLQPDTTRKQAMYIADVFSERLQMRSKWKAFQDLWHINNLAQEKWEMQETGKMPARSDEIDAIFAE